MIKQLVFIFSIAWVIVISFIAFGVLGAESSFVLTMYYVVMALGFPMLWIYMVKEF